MKTTKKEIQAGKECLKMFERIIRSWSEKEIQHWVKTGEFPATDREWVKGWEWRNKE